MNDRQIVLLLLAVVGAALLAHPLYAYPHATQTEHALVLDDPPPVAPDGETAAYGSLPESARSVVDAALADEYGHATVYSPSEAFGALDDYHAVEVDGAIHQYTVEGADSFGSATLFRAFLSGVAGIALAIALLGRRRAEFPRTTLRYGLVGTAGAAAGLASLEAHDAVLAPSLLDFAAVRVAAWTAPFAVLLGLVVLAGTAHRRLPPHR